MRRILGDGRRQLPGTASKNGPLPLSPTHPTLFDEKSGGAPSCAAAGASGAAAIRLAKMLLARFVCFNVNEDIVASPLVFLAFALTAEIVRFSADEAITSALASA
jgi:hypothetical protein